MEAFVVMPTLNASTSGYVMERALCLAGIQAGGVIVRDMTRRGGVKPSNLGFAAAIQSGAPFIAYLNDDVTVQKDWLKLLVEALLTHELYGMAAPGGRCSSIPQQDGRPGLPYGVQVVQQPLAWFCATIRRQVFIDVGVFDESYTHYADETDFEKRAHAKGWQSIYVQHVYVEHEVGHRDKEWWDKDTALYRSRWET